MVTPLDVSSFLYTAQSLTELLFKNVIFVEVD